MRRNLLTEIVDKSGKTVAPRSVVRRRAVQTNVADRQPLPTPEPSQQDLADTASDANNGTDNGVYPNPEINSYAYNTPPSSECITRTNGDTSAIPQEQVNQNAAAQEQVVNGEQGISQVATENTPDNAEILDPQLVALQDAITRDNNSGPSQEISAATTFTESSPPESRPKRRRTQGKNASTQNEAGASQEPARKRARRQSHITNGQNGGNTNGQEDGNAENQGEDQTAAAQEQEETELMDPEDVEIDPSSTTMLELTRNRAQGKTSEREKKMQEIDWTEVARRRRDGTPPKTVNQSTETNDQAGTTTGEQTEDAPAPARRTMQLRIVNGEITFDESSQHIDRQAQALADASSMTVDENADLTKRINRMTWINDKRRDPADRVSVYKMKSDPWNDEDTDRFYEALRMFGTDFSTIANMFPPRTRRQIKLKYTREQRIDPQRLETALSGGQILKMDLSYFANAAGIELSEFKDPAIVNAELEKDAVEKRLEIEKKKTETDEAKKQRDIMDQQRDKDQEERDREKAEAMARRRAQKKKGRGFVFQGTGSLG